MLAFRTIAQLLLVLTIILPHEAHSQGCVDPDGDGYGMNGNRPCRTRKNKHIRTPVALNITSRDLKEVSSNYARLEITFSSPVKASLRFGTDNNNLNKTGPYQGFSYRNTLVQNLTGLSANTKYYYRIVAYNQSKERLISSIFEFSTVGTDTTTTTVPPTTTTLPTTTTTTTTSSSTTTSSTTTTLAAGHPLITSDPARLTLAASYELFYFEHVDAHHDMIQDLWSDSYSSQGTPTANELYFWLTPYQNMARMLALADALERKTHVAKYRDILVSVVLEMGPRFMNGVDAPINNETSKYRNNGSRTPTETRYAYLGLTRGLDWLGYVSYMLKEQEVLTSAEEAAINDLQRRFIIAMDWIRPTLDGSGLCDWDHGGFPHMPSHMLTGMIFLEENGGYSFPEFSDCFNYIISEIDSRNGNVGSDISHDKDSVSNFMVWRDWQMLTGQEITVSDAWLTKIGDYEAQQIAAYNAGTGGRCLGALCQSLGDQWIAEHALFTGRSNGITNYVKAPNLTNYPSMGGPKGGDSSHDSINQVQTVVSAAWGYANRRDNE